MKYLILIAALATVPACSPYVYKDEVGGIAAGAAALQSAATQGRVALDTSFRENQHLRLALGARKDPAFTGGCARGRSAPHEACQILFRGELPSVGPVIPVRYPDIVEVFDGHPKADGKGRETGAGTVLAALSAYAGGLAEITDATDRATFDANAKVLADSAAKLGAAFNPAVGLALGEGLSLLSALSGAILDQRRLSLLRRVVFELEGDPEGGQPGPLHAAMIPLLPDAFKLLRSKRIETLRERQKILDAALPKGRGVAAHDKTVYVADAYRDLAMTLAALNQSDPAAAIDAFKKAHTMLAEALRDDGRQLSSLRETVNALLKRANSVKSAFAAL